MCGVDVEKADKAPPRAGREGQVDDIYLHNQDWERNERRCPMYLTQILEVDLNWLGENWEQNAADEDWEVRVDFFKFWSIRCRLPFFRTTRSASTTSTAFGRSSSSRLFGRRSARKSSFRHS